MSPNSEYARHESLAPLELLLERASLYRQAIRGKPGYMVMQTQFSVSARFSTTCASSRPRAQHNGQSALSLAFCATASQARPTLPRLPSAVGFKSAVSGGAVLSEADGAHWCPD